MDHHKPPVFLPIETKAREFDGKLLLAFHLANKGYPIFIGSRSETSREIMFHNKAIYIAKSISTESPWLKFYNTLKEKGSTIILLDEESAVLPYKNDAIIKSRYPMKALPYADYIFVPGARVREKILELLNVSETGIYVTGHPRFDLLKPEYRDYYSYLNKHMLNKYNLQGYILINTNFVSGNHYLGPEHLQNYLSNNKDIVSEIKDGLSADMIFSNKIFRLYLGTIDRIAKEFDGCGIVVRPHPGESIDSYRNAFKNYSNIIVTNEGNVAEWIIGASLVIHYDCTTGIESVLAGKPTVCYRPIEREGFGAWLPVFLSEQVNTEKELFELIRSYLYNRKVKTYKLENNKRDELIKYIANAGELESVSTITKIIDNMLDVESKISSIKHFDVMRLLYNEVRKIKLSLAFMKRRIKGENVKSIYKHKFGKITKKEIENKLHLLANTYKIKKFINVNKYSNDMYLIYCDTNEKSLK